MPQPRARPAGGFRPNLRPDHNGTQRAQFESNKKDVLNLLIFAFIIPQLYWKYNLVGLILG